MSLLLCNDGYSNLKNKTKNIYKKKTITTKKKPKTKYLWLKYKSECLFYHFPSKYPWKITSNIPTWTAWNVPVIADKNMSRNIKKKSPKLFQLLKWFGETFQKPFIPALISQNISYNNVNSLWVCFCQCFQFTSALYISFFLFFSYAFLLSILTFKSFLKTGTWTLHVWYLMHEF